MSPIYHLEDTSFPNSINLPGSTNMVASYTKSALLIFMHRTFKSMLGKVIIFFRFFMRGQKPLNDQKIFLAVAELSMLITFIHQCHFLSIFWYKRHTFVALGNLFHEVLLELNSKVDKLYQAKTVPNSHFYN